MSAAIACDTCDTWTITLTDGWWQVRQLPDGAIHHYCTPDCALRGLAGIEPTEEVA